MYEKAFDVWNAVKKSLDVARGFVGAHERELWWVSLGVNIGIETDGKQKTFERPCVVLRAFNKDMVWVLPITSQQKSGPFYYSFQLNEKTYYIALTQIRTISTKRLLRKIGTLSQEHFAAIRQQVSGFVLNERNSAQGGASRRPKP